MTPRYTYSFVSQNDQCGQIKKIEYVEIHDNGLIISQLFVSVLPTLLFG